MLFYTLHHHVHRQIPILWLPVGHSLAKFLNQISFANFFYVYESLLDVHLARIVSCFALSLAPTDVVFLPVTAGTPALMHGRVSEADWLCTVLLHRRPTARHMPWVVSCCVLSFVPPDVALWTGAAGTLALMHGQVSEADWLCSVPLNLRLTAGHNNLLQPFESPDVRCLRNSIVTLVGVSQFECVSSLTFSSALAGGGSFEAAVSCMSSSQFSSFSDSCSRWAGNRSVDGSLC